MGLGFSQIRKQIRSAQELDISFNSETGQIEAMHGLLSADHGISDVRVPLGEADDVLLQLEDACIKDKTQRIAVNDLLSRQISDEAPKVG